LAGHPGWRAMTPRCISRRAGPPWRIAAAPRAAPIGGRIMTRLALPIRAPSVVSRLRLPRRLRGWLRRSLPAGLSGTVSALPAAQLVLMASQSLALAALCGSIGETVGYYAAAIVRDVTAHYRLHRGHDSRRRLWLTCFTSLRSLLIEFGPAA